MNTETLKNLKNGAPLGLRSARNGKIARLPRHVRDELNTRLEDGAAGPQLLAWLNEESEVREILEQEFAGRPINAQNLSEWRLGGFREWQRHQVACDHVRRLGERAEALAEAADGERFSDQLAQVFAVELLTTMERLLAATTDAKVKLRYLREGLREIRLLRRGDHNGARLAMEQERWERQRLAEDEAREAAQLAAHKQKMLARAFSTGLRPGKVAEFGGGTVGAALAETIDRVQRNESLEGVMGSIPPAKPKGRARKQKEATKTKPKKESKSGQIKVNQTKSNQKIPVAQAHHDEARDRRPTRADMVEMAAATGLEVHWRNPETGKMEVVYPPGKEPKPTPPPASPQGGQANPA